MNGWICSYRSIWRHPFFEGNGVRVAIWHWLLHHAAWEDTTHRIGAAKITLKRGEVCFSQQQIQDDTGASRKEVRAVLEWLLRTRKAVKIGANERANGGASVRANARTLLAIEKYEEYQGQDRKRANGEANKGADEGPTKEQDKQINNSVSKETEASASQPASREVSPASDLSSLIFGQGLDLLVQAGRNDQAARSILGKWRRDHGEAAVIEALGKAQREGAIDPVGYIEGVFRFQKQRASNAPAERPGTIHMGAFGRAKEIC